MMLILFFSNFSFEIQNQLKTQIKNTNIYTPLTVWQRHHRCPELGVYEELFCHHKGITGHLGTVQSVNQLLTKTSAQACFGVLKQKERNSTTGE